MLDALDASAPARENTPKDPLPHIADIVDSKTTDLAL
jgi:hypothetical protein